MFYKILPFLMRDGENKNKKKGSKEVKCHFNFTKLYLKKKKKLHTCFHFFTYAL